MTSETLQVVSVRDQPEELECFIACFSRWWGSEATLPVYRDCMTSCLESPSSLPQWYLLRDDGDAVLGGVGLVTNDFISRMDLWPWLCALYVEEGRRGRDLGRMLIEHVKVETARLGFGEVYRVLIILATTGVLASTTSDSGITLGVRCRAFMSASWSVDGRR